MSQDPNSALPPIDAGVTPPVGYQTPSTLAPIETNKDARLWGMLCHLSVLAGYVIPVGHIIGPLVIWLIKKNEIPFVDEQGKESLNFQITVTLAFIVCIPLIFVLIGIPLLIAVGIADLVLVIIAAVKTNNGEHYRYPFALRLIK
ncbi:MAG TPA: DUF4870 domain-containing protein [Tepidisphaeraceae bacterium]|jgi:hypothetical protein|nr:DUF4870 domain-containing protein [Tepidisphaeraceae bacterium]